MSEYKRSTTEKNYNGLNPFHTGSIKDHADKFELGNIEDKMIMCCETSSVKESKKLFRKVSETTTCSAVLTPDYLIWATSKDSERPAVLSARLRDIQVRDYENSDYYKMILDTGINITGIFTDSAETGTVFIGFGKEPAAEKFRKKLKETCSNTGL